MDDEQAAGRVNRGVGTRNREEGYPAGEMDSDCCVMFKGERR